MAKPSLNVMYRAGLRCHDHLLMGLADHMCIEEDDRETKIDDLDGAIVCFREQEEILRLQKMDLCYLQITMADAIRMAVVQCLYDLEEDGPCLLLGEVALLDDAIEQLPTLANPKHPYFVNHTPSPNTRCVNPRRSRTV